MFALVCSLNERPSEQTWDLVSGILYQMHSSGIDEGEEPAPQGEAALQVGNEFADALTPGILPTPKSFTAYFESKRDAQKAERAIQPHLTSLGLRSEITTVVQENYVEKWKDSVQPVFVHPHWLIVPPWMDFEKTAKSLGLDSKRTFSITLEPGMAFGTGTHETTRGCLNLLGSFLRKEEFQKDLAEAHILDFGCGSGILAIALKKMGVGHVTGIDIDPLAIDACHKNATLNGVDFDAILSSENSEIAFSPQDGIVANILKNTLLHFAQSFCKWVRPNGFLILSGLLAEQEVEVLERYQSLGFVLESRLNENNWITLGLRYCPQPQS